MINSCESVEIVFIAL